MTTMQKLTEYLAANAYPGRGIYLGKSEDGLSAVIAYFIMGRSANSRNRVFETTADGIRTKAFDESKLEDPSLIIYHPVRQLGDVTIVTNGDQTDTIRDALLQGEALEDALRTRTFEPDGPHFTPRISGLVEPGHDRVRLSILKAACGDGRCTQREFFEYTGLPAGTGRIIHTYRGDGNPLPSFEGEPAAVSAPDDLDALTGAVWDALNEENKISLYTAFVDLATGETTSRVVNKLA